MTKELHEKVVEILEQNGLQELPTTLREADLGGGRYLFPAFAIRQLRGMKVDELNALTSRKRNKDGEAVNEILQNCADETKAIDWLIGDRTFALLQIKRRSHGDDYTFRCDCPHCTKMTDWTEDLGSLPVRYIQEPGKTSGFKVQLPAAEREIIFRLLTGVDERKLNNLRSTNDEEMQSALMLFRTEQIEGEKMKTMKWFNQLEAIDHVAFQEAVDEQDCGVDTTIAVECSHCFRTFETELPVGIDFFLPKKMPRKR